MPDDPVTLGEVVRGLQDVKKSVDKLGDRVLTVEVWSAERQGLDQRFKAIEDDVRELQDKRQKDVVGQENRRWLIYLALITATLAFISQLWFASRGQT